MSKTREILITLVIALTIVALMFAIPALIDWVANWSERVGAYQYVSHAVVAAMNWILEVYHV